VKEPGADAPALHAERKSLCRCRRPPANKQQQVWQIAPRRGGLFFFFLWGNESPPATQKGPRFGKIYLLKLFFRLLADWTCPVFLPQGLFPANRAPQNDFCALRLGSKKFPRQISVPPRRQQVPVPPPDLVGMKTPNFASSRFFSGPHFSPTFPKEKMGRKIKFRPPNRSRTSSPLGLFFTQITTIVTLLSLFLPKASPNLSPPPLPKENRPNFGKNKFFRPFLKNPPQFTTSQT